MSEGLDDCTHYEGKDGYAIVDKFQYEAMQKQWESQRQELLDRLMVLELENENLRRQDRGEKKLTKPQMARLAVTELLKATGWVYQGDHEGRARFSLPDTDRWATVGQKTTCLYRVIMEMGAQHFLKIPTVDIEAIKDAIEAEHPNLRRKHTVKLNVTVDSTEVEFEVESTAHEDEIKEAAERAVRRQIHVEWEIAD